MVDNAPPVAVSVGIIPPYLVPYPTDLSPPLARVLVTTMQQAPSNPNAPLDPAPPITVSVAVKIPATVDALLYLTSPAPDEVVIIAMPTFVVGLQTPNLSALYQVEVQYAADAAFTAPISGTVAVQGVDGGGSYVPTTSVFATTWWRARLLKDGESVVDWTAASTFTLDQVSGSETLPIVWSVDGGADRPVHLWHFDPPGVEEGDDVILYGQGFPISPGSVSLYGQPVAYQSWDLVPATDAAASADRVIDGDVVDAEHFEITFVAPPVEEPGGPLTVEA